MKRDLLLFTGWMLTGALAMGALGAVFALPVFLLLGALAGGMLALMAGRRDTRRGLPGLLAAAALPLALLTWGNRHGPGEYCAHGACQDGLANPWPFGIAAAVLLALAVALLLRLRRR
ncbi:hypothetical protein GXW82_01375 [Streptacidiphilus sp. 4-A2]|nr:hypothetical protein [Streptacidiphilus sp. 4-A2]